MAQPKATPPMALQYVAAAAVERCAWSVGVARRAMLAAHVPQAEDVLAVMGLALKYRTIGDVEADDEGHRVAEAVTEELFRCCDKGPFAAVQWLQDNAALVAELRAYMTPRAALGLDAAAAHDDQATLQAAYDRACPNQQTHAMV